MARRVVTSREQADLAEPFLRLAAPGDSDGLADWEKDLLAGAAEEQAQSSPELPEGNPIPPGITPELMGKHYPEYNDPARTFSHVFHNGDLERQKQHVDKHLKWITNPSMSGFSPEHSAKWKAIHEEAFGEPWPGSDTDGTVDQEPQSPHSQKAQDVAEHFAPAGMQLKTMDEFFGDHVPEGSGPTADDVYKNLVNNASGLSGVVQDTVNTPEFQKWFSQQPPLNQKSFADDPQKAMGYFNNAAPDSSSSEDSVHYDTLLNNADKQGYDSDFIADPDFQEWFDGKDSKMQETLAKHPDGAIAMFKAEHGMEDDDDDDPVEIAGVEASPGLIHFDKMNEHHGEGFTITPHFAEWINENHPDFDGEHDYNLYELHDEYAHPFTYQSAPSWWDDDYYADEAYEYLSEWESHQGPEIIQDYFNDWDHGGWEAQESFEDFLDGYGIWHADALDKAAADEGVDVKPSEGYFQEWKEDLPYEAFDYYTDHPSDCASDYWNWQEFDNGETNFYYPSYPGAQAKVNYGNLDSVPDDEEVKRILGPLASGGAFEYGFLPYVLNHSGYDIESYWDLENITGGSWENLVSGWNSLDDKKQQEYKNLEHDGLHPSSLDISSSSSSAPPAASPSSASGKFSGPVPSAVEFMNMGVPPGDAKVMASYDSDKFWNALKKYVEGTQTPVTGGSWEQVLKWYHKHKNLANQHENLINSPGFKEWFKKANSGFDLDAPGNASTLKQLGDSHNDWVIGKLLSYKKHLEDTGQVPPEQEQYATDYGQKLNDPKFYNWVNNAEYPHSKLYQAWPQYALAHYDELENPPPGFSMWYAATPGASTDIGTALRQYHNLDHGKDHWIAKEQEAAKGSIAVPSAQNVPANLKANHHGQLAPGVLNWLWDEYGQHVSYTTGQGNWIKAISGKSSTADHNWSPEDWAVIGQHWAEMDPDEKAKYINQDMKPALEKELGLVPPGPNTNATPASSVSPDQIESWKHAVAEQVKFNEHGGPSGWVSMGGSYTAWLGKQSPATLKHFAEVPGAAAEDFGKYINDYQNYLLPDVPPLESDTKPGHGAVLTMPDVDLLKSWGVSNDQAEYTASTSPESFISNLEIVYQGGPESFPPTSKWGKILKGMQDLGWQPGMNIGDAIPGATQGKPLTIPTPEELKNWGLTYGWSSTSSYGPEDFVANLEHVYKDPEGFSNDGGWGGILKYMLEQGWKPGMKIGDIPEASSAAAKPLTVPPKEDLEKLGIDPATAEYINELSDDNILANLKIVHKDPASYNGGSWKKFYDYMVGQGWKPGMQIGDMAQGSASSPGSIPLDPPAASYDPGKPPLEWAQKHFGKSSFPNQAKLDTWYKQYEGITKDSDLPSMIRHWRNDAYGDKDDYGPPAGAGGKKPSDNVLPPLYKTTHTPESLLDPVSGDLVPEFVNWLWDAADKTITPKEFVNLYKKWTPSQWKAAEQAFLNPSTEEEGAEAAPVSAPSHGLASDDQINELAELMNKNGRWVTHTHDFNIWAHTLTAAQAQKIIHEYDTSEYNNPADEDFDQFLHKQWWKERDDFKNFVHNETGQYLFDMPVSETGKLWRKWKGLDQEPKDVLGEPSSKPVDNGFTLPHESLVNQLADAMSGYWATEDSDNWQAWAQSLTNSQIESYLAQHDPDEEPHNPADRDFNHFYQNEWESGNYADFNDIKQDITEKHDESWGSDWAQDVGKAFAKWKWDKEHGGTAEAAPAPAPDATGEIPEFDRDAFWEELDATNPSWFAKNFWTTKPPEVIKERLQHWIESFKEKDAPEEAAKLQKVYDKYFGGGVTPAPPSPAADDPEALYNALMEALPNEGWGKVFWTEQDDDKKKETLQSWIDKHGDPDSNGEYAPKKAEALQKIYDQFYGDEASGGGTVPFQGGVEFAKEYMDAIDWTNSSPEIVNTNGLKFKDMTAEQAKAHLEKRIAGGDLHGSSLQNLQALYDKYFGSGTAATAKPTGPAAFDLDDIISQLVAADPVYWSGEGYGNKWLSHAENRTPESLKDQLKKFINYGEKSLAEGTTTYTEEEVQAYRDLYEKYFGGGTAPVASQPLQIKPFDKKEIDNLLYQADSGHWGNDANGMTLPETYKKELLGMIKAGQSYIDEYGEGAAWSNKELDIYRQILADYFGVDEKGNALAAAAKQFDPSAMFAEFKEHFPNSILTQSDFGTHAKAKAKLDDLLDGSIPYYPETLDKLKSLYEKYLGGGAPSASSGPAAPSAPPKPPMPPGLSSFPVPGESAMLDYSVRYDLGQMANKVRAEHTIYNGDDLNLMRDPEFQKWFAAAPSDYRTVSREFPSIALDDYKSGNGYGWIPQQDPGDIAHIYKTLFPPGETTQAGGKYRAPSGEVLQLPGSWENHWPGHTKNPVSDDRARPKIEFIPKAPDVPGQLEIPLPGGSSWEPEYELPELHRGITLDFDRYRTHDGKHPDFEKPGIIGARHRAAAQLLDEIRAEIYGPEKGKSHNLPRQEDLFTGFDDDKKDYIPDTPPRPDDVDDWLDFVEWAKDKNMPPEQMWELAKQYGSKNPNKYGTPPLSYFLHQAWHDPHSMARQITKLTGEKFTAKKLSDVYHKLDNLSGRYSDAPDDVKATAKEWKQKWFNDNFLPPTLGQKILDYLELGGWKPGGFKSHPDFGGFGPHWSTSTGVAGGSFGGGSATSSSIPVRITIGWPGLGEDPDRKHDAKGYTSERELTLNPGSPVVVKKIEIRHPLHPDSDWIALDTDPHVRHAAMTPRKSGRSILSHRERFATDNGWDDYDENYLGPDGGRPSSFDTPMFRAEDRPARGDGSFHFSPREINPPSTSGSRPEVYRPQRVDTEDPLPGMPPSYYNVPLFRGVAINLNDPHAADIYRNIYGEHPDDEHLFDHGGRAPRYDHPELSGSILDYLEHHRPRTGPKDPIHGLGPHWTLNPMLAHEFAVGESLSALNDPGAQYLPVRLKGDWAGPGENPYRDGTQESYDGEFSNEDEINLLPGAGLNISDVQIRHPQQRRWMSVPHQTQRREANTPVPIRPRNAKRITTQRELMEG